MPRVSGRTFEVQGELWIGRAPGNQIVVEDEGISRRHTRVIPSGDTYVLIDENSATPARAVHGS